MSNANTLVISHKNLNNSMDLKNILTKCNTALKSMNCYSSKKSKELNRQIKMHDCKNIQGNLYGHFPFYIPQENKKERPHLFFVQLLTASNENINGAKEQISMTISSYSDSDSEVFLTEFAKNLDLDEHRYFLGSSPKDLTELHLGGELLS